ncbi:MAG: RIP metalloprotease RseP [Burkholderiaceae bacterium]
MTAIISFLIAITILVFVHEFGHYIVARIYGVKVLRFSIGFGYPIFKKIDSHGTEWVLSAIPLGGYVTMWDHLNTKQKGLDNLKKSYSNKSLIVRSAIVFGGPLANFIFAIVAFTCIFSLESYKTLPVIDIPTPGSIAQINGLEKNDKILAVNGQKINSFEELNSYIKDTVYYSDSKSVININFLRKNKNIKNVSLDISGLKHSKFENITKSIGLLPRSRGVKIVDVLDHSLAKEVGLKKGDVILSMDELEVNFPKQITDIIKSNNKRQMQLEYLLLTDAANLNKNDTTSKAIKKLILNFDDSKQVLGVYLVANTQKFKTSMSFIEALKNGFSQTVKVINVCLTSIYKLFTSGSPFENLGGPISIANAAENSANSGTLAFLGFLAFFSVSIGVINLLPIPVLDGGHLLYHIIEFIKGEPLSASFKLTGTWLGIIFIVGLTFIAISNDVLSFLK